MPVESIQKSLKGVVPMDSQMGTNTASTQEEDTLGEAPFGAGHHHHHQALERSELVDAVPTVCMDGRATPYDPEKDPGQGWV